jgi:hypothetical protein
VRTLQTWARPHWPQGTARPQASATAPHSIFARSHNSRAATQRCPPASHTKPERQTPHATLPPQPSAIAPHTMPALSQVSGEHDSGAEAPAADGVVLTRPASSSGIACGAARFSELVGAGLEPPSLQAAMQPISRLITRGLRNMRFPFHAATQQDTSQAQAR